MPSQSISKTATAREQALILHHIHFQDDIAKLQIARGQRHPEVVRFSKVLFAMEKNFFRPVNLKAYDSVTQKNELLRDRKIKLTFLMGEISFMGTRVKSFNDNIH